MKYRSPLDYIKIDIANSYGLDKEPWDNRIAWVDDQERDPDDSLENQAFYADSPILYRKAVRALRDAQAGIPTGFIMGLDASASGVQVMTVLSGCHKTAKHVNLINTGNRENLYRNVSDHMNKMPGVVTDAGMLKKPVMTTMYGSRAQPKSVFGEGTPELAAYYKMLNDELPGAIRIMKTFEWCWDPHKKAYSWTLPDGHVARCKVMEAVDKKIEVDELNHATFTHRAELNMPREYGIEIIANVTHSIDGYIARQMVQMAFLQGFELAHIHDSFWCSPQHMHKARQNYVHILCHLSDINLMQSIVSELKGRPYTFTKTSNNLSTLIKDAEYPLS